MKIIGEISKGKYIKWRRLNQPTDEDLLIMAARMIRRVTHTKETDKFLCVQISGEEKKIANADTKKFENNITILS